MTRHAGQTHLTISHLHAQAPWVQQVCRDIAAFVKTLRQTAEQFTPRQCGCRILSRALVKYLGGANCSPPPPCLHRHSQIPLPFRYHWLPLRQLATSWRWVLTAVFRMNVLPGRNGCSGQKKAPSQ